MSITASHEMIFADHGTARRLGNWTDSGCVHVRARSASVLLDLRSPGLPDEVEVRVEVERATVKLLVPENAVVDQWDLSWAGRGKVKDYQAADETSGRRIRLTGTARNGEIRINRGGVATLSAMTTREGFADLRRAHKAGTQSALVDPQAR